MRLDISDILARVTRTETERAGYNRMAKQWRDAYMLKAFDRTQAEALAEGQEQVVLPTPYNVVNLAQRLISTVPKIDVPPVGVTAAGDTSAETCERWLNAFWYQVNKSQNRNIIADATWQAFVLGRFVFEIKWIDDVLPKALRKQRLPILVRTLDPANVGVKQGPIWTEYAFHKYTDDLMSVKQRYPKLKLPARRIDKVAGRWEYEDTDVEVVDFWWMNFETGKVWNAVVVDQSEFAKKPTETDYPDIPIIEQYGDTTPLDDEAYKSLSLLHPLTATELWKYQCRLASQMATGLLWYFWPAITVTNERGEAIDDIKIGPGETNSLPPGTKVDMIQLQPNVPLAQAMDGRVDGEIQNSTFPGVMYGKAPGDLQAGYGVSLLSDAAKGRIKSFLENLEFALCRVHALVLGLIGEFAEEEGVKVWGYDERAAAPYRLALTPADVANYKETVVSLKPQIPNDLMQRQTLGLQLVQAGIISRRTYRDKFMDTPAPADEQARIELEMAMQDPKLKDLTSKAALAKYFGPDYEELLGLKPPAPPPGPPPGMGPGGPPPPGMGPGGPPPPPIQPPATLVGPQGGGIPPEIQGQLTPELMGMPSDTNPLLFAQMMGRQLPPSEVLDNLAGGPS